MIINARPLALPAVLTFACAVTASAGTLTPSFTGSGVGAFTPADAQQWTGVNRTQENAVFEVNFDYQNESEAHVLFDLGGTTDGSSLTLDGDRLVWHTRDNGSGIDVVSSDIPAGLDNTNIQVVVGIAMNDNGVNERIEIFVNGVSVASDNTQDQGVDWAGNNTSVLGNQSQLAAPSTTLDFAYTPYNDGNIDFAFYAVSTYTETFDQVLADVVIPEPSSLALLGLGGLLIARRRR